MGRRPNHATADNIIPMRADAEHLGAEDIIGRGDVRVRIAAVVVVPKGHRIGGTPSKSPTKAAVLDVLTKNGWKRAKKIWLLSCKKVREVLYVRCGSVHAEHMAGVELDLYADPTRRPGRPEQGAMGKFTFGIRIRLLPEEHDEDYVLERMRLAASRRPPGEEFEDTDQRQPCNEHGVVDCTDCEAAQEPPQDDEPSGCPACGWTDGHDMGCPEAPEETSE